MSEVVYIDKHDGLVDLSDVIRDNEKVVVVFSARDWCIPCRRLHPHVVQAAKELSDYTFVDVDIDHVDGVKEDFGIMSVPQIWYYEDARNGLPGREINAQTTAIRLIADLKQ